MKKALCFAGMFLAMTFMGSAANAQSKLSWDVLGGVSVPLTSGYDLGFGAEGSGNLDLGSGLDLTGTVGYYTFNVTGSTSTASASAASLEILAGIKYFLGTTSTKPFLTAGVGLSDYIATVTVSNSYISVSGSGSSIYPEITGGAGVQIGLGTGSNVAIVIATKLGLVLSSGSSFTYLPITAGVSF